MEEKTCLECLHKTKDYYKIDTNTGKFYRCRDCYELVYMRELREDYRRNPSQEPVDD